jgi:serine/threonine protein kinase
VSAPELAVGQVVDGKYEIQELLGRSGSVATYRAVKAPNLAAALKFYDPRLESFPDVVNALARCETLMTDLPDELVVHIVDGGMDPVTGSHYTVTHFDADSSLADVVAWGPLSPPEMVALIRSLGRALDAAHARGLAHLSLKPTNLFVGSGPAYNVRLVDFAMSLVHGALSSSDERRASAPWLAPEQDGDATGARPAADVFGTALLAFFALTGASYWRSCQADSFDELGWRSELLGGRVPVSERARELGISLDASFDPAFARALAVLPDERFRTAGDFAEALAAALAGEIGTLAVVSEAPASLFAANLAAAEFEQPGPTSTSAMILAPSSPPEPYGSSRASEPFPAADVPPPPAQMDAVLTAYETAAPDRFPMQSSATLPTGTEAPVVPVRPRSIRTAASKWSPLVWVAAAAAGVLVAAGIVGSIVFQKSPSAAEQATNSPAPLVAAVPEAPAAPAGASPRVDNANPSTTSPGSVEPMTRATNGKPSSKTVRSPAQPRGAASSAPRKPCGKSSKPCK